MTKDRPRSAEAKAFLRNARAHLKAAGDLMVLADQGSAGNPIMSEAVLGVIALADALCLQFGGNKNKQDHAAIVQALKKCLGNRADDKQLNRLARLISQKSEIQYEHRQLTIAEAEKYLADSKKFAAWAEEVLAQEGVG